MKRLIISVISIALMACITIRSNYSSDAKEAYVTAQSGLLMRSEPSMKGRKLLNIPVNSRVVVLEEKDNVEKIAGRTGKWTKVKYGSREGWVFGGFLSYDLKKNSGSERDEGSIGFLPGKMISVQKHNNSYRIYYSCMCDGEIITIDTNNNSLNVYSICQEDQLNQYPERYRCKITATERKGEDTILVISNCIPGFGDKGTYQVEFEFSRDGEVIHLRVFSDAPLRGTGDYIDLRKKGHYPVIHQDCADFDG